MFALKVFAFFRALFCFGCVLAFGAGVIFAVLNEPENGTFALVLCALFALLSFAYQGLINSYERR